MVSDREFKLRPIGTRFVEVHETTAERIITTLQVVAHQRGADGQMYELVHEIDEQRQPKTLLGGSERKSE